MGARGEQRAIAVSAAGIYAGAMVVGLIEVLIPGGPEFSVIPGVMAAIIAPLVALVGPRLSRRVLALLGPLGIGLIASALATTHGYADAAVMYMWPVLWMANFYGRRGTLVSVVCVAAAHGIALSTMPGTMGNVDRWVDVTVSVLVVGTVVHLLSMRNIRLVARLVAEARIDPLTGLLNRRGFDERMRVEVPRADRDGTTLGVVMLDIDHFKTINDRYGHDVGDRVLAWLGALLKEQVRGVDIVARLGGEEFVLVLPRCEAPQARLLAERVRVAVAMPGPGSDRRRHGIPDGVGVTVSAGVAAASTPVDPIALIAAADAALYAAKRSGRDRTAVHGQAVPAVHTAQGRAAA